MRTYRKSLITTARRKAIVANSCSDWQDSDELSFWRMKHLKTEM